MAVKHSEALTLSLLGYSMNLAWSALGGLIYLTVRKGIPVSDAATKPPV